MMFNYKHVITSPAFTVRIKTALIMSYIAQHIRTAVSSSITLKARIDICQTGEVPLWLVALP